MKIAKIKILELMLANQLWYQNWHFLGVSDWQYRTILFGLSHIVHLKI